MHADVREVAAVRQSLGDEEFDAVVDWVGFTPDHIASDLALPRTYEPVGVHQLGLGVPDATSPPPGAGVHAVAQPIWEYSRNKIACEELLSGAHRNEGFPATVVRPSHTYDRTLVPFDGGWTVVERMRQGKEIVVHGGGTSLRPLTHHEDFARGFVPLLGNPRTVGEPFHITSDDVLRWNQIAESLAEAAGVKALTGAAESNVAGDAELVGRELVGTSAARQRGPCRGPVAVAVARLVRRRSGRRGRSGRRCRWPRRRTRRVRGWPRGRRGRVPRCAAPSAASCASWNARRACSASACSLLSVVVMTASLLLGCRAGAATRGI